MRIELPAESYDSPVKANETSNKNKDEESPILEGSSGGSRARSRSITKDPPMLVSIAPVKETASGAPGVVSGLSASLRFEGGVLPRPPVSPRAAAAAAASSLADMPPPPPLTHSTRPSAKKEMSSSGGSGSGSLSRTSGGTVAPVAKGFADHSAAIDAVSTSLSMRKLHLDDAAVSAATATTTATTTTVSTSFSGSAVAVPTGNGLVVGSYSSSAFSAVQQHYKNGGTATAAVTMAMSMSNNNQISSKGNSSSSAKQVSFSLMNQTIDADNTIRKSSVAMAVVPPKSARDDRDADSDDDLPKTNTVYGKSPVPVPLVGPATTGAIDDASANANTASSVLKKMPATGTSPSAITMGIAAMGLAAQEDENLLIPPRGDPTTGTAGPGSTGGDEGEDGDRVTASNTMLNKLHGVTGGSHSQNVAVSSSLLTSTQHPGASKDLHLEIASLANSISQVNPSRNFAASGRHSSLRSTHISSSLTMRSSNTSSSTGGENTHHHHHAGMMVSSSVMEMMTVDEESEYYDDSGNANGNGDNDEQQDLTEKAVIVIRRVLDKLTGLDFVSTNPNDLHNLGASISGAGSGGVHPPSPNTSGSTTSSSGSVSALEVKEQVDRLIHEATSNENLSQSFFGWCPFW